MIEYPSVSIIIVNLNGKNLLEECLKSIKNSDYPKSKIEIIVFDNGSTDDSVKWLKKNYPEINLIEHDCNIGFCTANNLAARAANHECLVFLNNDMRVEKNWLLRLAFPLIQSGQVASTAAQILSWDGKQVYFRGGDSDIFANASQKDMHSTEIKLEGENTEIPFACGGAMMTRKCYFLDSGGFDDNFFAYYEDVDLGFRYKILGFKNVFVPDAIVYHKHSETSKKLPIAQVRRLQIRNPLWIMLKNYEDETLKKVLLPGILLSLKRSFAFTGDFKDSKFDTFKIESATTWRDQTFLNPTGYDNLLLSDLIGYNDFLENFEHFSNKRTHIQNARKCSDQELFALFGKMFTPIDASPSYVKLYTQLIDFFKLTDVVKKQDLSSPRRKRLLGKIFNGKSTEKRLSGKNI